MPKGRGGASPMSLLKWPAWALGVLAVGSAFAPMPAGFLRGLHWALCLFSILEAGVSIGTRRPASFFVYAGAAILFNPFRPFFFAPQIWRLVHAGMGVWLVGDHIQER